ncbi:MAG: hypothetical protein KTR21_03525 [Rhodobacteraceae bacterium]|nr:hypothetical protein [Paracoccaceae bacterium]
MRYTGGCHCSNITLSYETHIPPGETVTRACQCSFCRKHNTLAVADPVGGVEIGVKSEHDANRYRFGLETAEYLLCRVCGVYVAALTVAAPQRALVIVNCLDDRLVFSRAPTASQYDHETLEERLQRRAATWTPLTPHVASKMPP